MLFFVLRNALLTTRLSRLAGHGLLLLLLLLLLLTLLRKLIVLMDEKWMAERPERIPTLKLKPNTETNSVRPVGDDILTRREDLPGDKD